MRNDTVKGKKYSLRLLAARSRSEYEIKNRLLKAGYDDTVSKNIVNALRKEKILDDARFASEWIDSRLDFSPRAVEVIRSELEEKGVSDDTIQQVFLKKSKQLDNRTIALNLVKDKVSLEKALSGEKLRVKVFRFLVSRGFAADLSEEIVESM